MLTNNWHPAFVLAGSDVALQIEQTLGNNPTDGRELNDLVENVITPESKVRCVFVDAA